MKGVQVVQDFSYRIGYPVHELDIAAMPDPGAGIEGGPAFRIHARHSSEWQLSFYLQNIRGERDSCLIAIPEVRGHNLVDTQGRVTCRSHCVIAETWVRGEAKRGFIYS